MTRPDQLALPLAHRPAQGRDDFLVSSSNRAAFSAVTEPENPLGSRFAVSGPEGAGKTHLASIWGARTGAVSLALSELSESRLAQLHEAPAIVLEDADRLADAPGAARRPIETLLFHLLNVCAAEGIPLMLTGRTPPARWPVETPDLESRLAALPHVVIQPPDDMLLSSILHKLFRDRQVTVGRDVIQYLTVRMDRSFAAAEQLVARLDERALARRRGITRPLAAEFFAEERPERDDEAKA